MPQLNKSNGEVSRGKNLTCQAVTIVPQLNNLRVQRGKNFTGQVWRTARRNLKVKEADFWLFPFETVIARINARVIHYFVYMKPIRFVYTSAVAARRAKWI